MTVIGTGGWSVINCSKPYKTTLLQRGVVGGAVPPVPFFCVSIPVTYNIHLLYYQFFPCWLLQWDIRHLLLLSSTTCNIKSSRIGVRIFFNIFIGIIIILLKKCFSLCAKRKKRKRSLLLANTNIPYIPTDIDFSKY